MLFRSDVFRIHLYIAADYCDDTFRILFLHPTYILPRFSIRQCSYSIFFRTFRNFLKNGSDSPALGPPPDSLPSSDSWKRPASSKYRSAFRNREGHARERSYRRFRRPRLYRQRRNGISSNGRHCPLPTFHKRIVKIKRISPWNRTKAR